MKHEAGRSVPTVEHLAERTSGNEGHSSFVKKDSTFTGRIRKTGAKILIGVGGLTGIGMFTPSEKNIDQEALNSFKTRLISEQVLSETGDIFSTKEAKAAADFPDVPMTNPYYEAITGMKNAGIIDGYANGLFGVNDPVRRAQFAKMIVGTMGIEVNESMVAPFKDLGPDDQGTLYPHDYIAAVAQAGITKGVTPTEFKPWQEITRAQVITMAIRAFENLSPGLLREPPTDYEATILNFSDTHFKNLRKAEYNGLLIGLSGYFFNWDAWQTATRGECAQILYNLMTFERQEKSGADLVTIDILSRDQLPQELDNKLSIYPSNPTRIRRIAAEHSVNASKAISFYLARTERSGSQSIYERYIGIEDGDEEYLVTNYFPEFAVSSRSFKTYLVFNYPVAAGDMRTIMTFELGADFARRDQETGDEYKGRIFNIISQLEANNGEDGLIRPEEITDLLKASTKKVAFVHDSTYFTYDRDQGQGAVIEKIINSL